MIAKNKKTIIILTASGGAGGLQAAQAKKEQIKNSNIEDHILIKDIISWLGKIGKFGINSWNSAQSKGDVLSQEILRRLQCCAEFLFWPFIFIKLTILLFSKDNVDRVIDTQPICTQAIIKAIRLYNYWMQKHLLLEKLLIDLPTNKSKHFYNGIKGLSKKDKKLIKLITLYPLLEEEEKEEDFWSKHCDLTINNIKYENFFIRNEFKKFINKKREKKIFEVFINIKCKEEKKIMQKHFNLNKDLYKELDNGFIFKLKSQEKLISILLGSHPSIKSTCKYIKNISEIIKNNAHQKYYLFVFCSDFTVDKLNLFAEADNVLTNLKELPSNLSIILMSFQNSNTIASLFHLSDITITRSGGQTAMELMSVSTGKIFIHSEIDSDTMNDNILLKGMPLWESGNANYLIQKHKAELITPQIASKALREYI